jgi:Zn finger protein HypA/HybF involved in hydrogenase expression
VSDKLIQCHRCGDPVTNELGDNPICGACALASDLNAMTLQARITELEAENAIFRAADYEALRAKKLIYCAKCHDGIVADDDGICGVCAGAQDGVIESLQNKVAELKMQAIVWHKYPSLEAENASIKKALEKAAKSLYKSTQSCPRDMFDWEHPATCDIECNMHSHVDDAWKCWLDWLMGAK